MDNVQDLIARHAYITAGMQRARAAGAQIPQHIIEEHQRIEAGLFSCSTTSGL